MAVAGDSHSPPASALQLLLCYTLSTEARKPAFRSGGGARIKPVALRSLGRFLDPRKMDSRIPPLCSFLVLVLASSSLLHSARSDGHDAQLLKGINSYRSSLKVPALTENENAACLAEQLAAQFKGERCSNTTGANTVVGTERQFPDYPKYLDRCHLNASVTEDGQVMPACVPGLVPDDAVLANYTESQYNRFLNDSKFAGVGIASEGDWVVVVLSTRTASGDYSPAPPGSNWAAPSVHPSSHHHLTMVVLLLVGFVVLMMN